MLIKLVTLDVFNENGWIEKIFGLSGLDLKPFNLRYELMGIETMNFALNMGKSALTLILIPLIYIIIFQGMKILPRFMRLLKMVSPFLSVPW